MAFNFRPSGRGQTFLLPPSIDEWPPADHLAWFVIDAVERIDLASFRRAYRSDGRGGAAHHPAVIVGLLLYAYCIGVTSSRRIEKACIADVACRVIVGNDGPDHTTIELIAPLSVTLRPASGLRPPAPAPAPR